MIFAIDFDGTCVTHAWPAMGRDIEAQPVLKEMVANGHQLILWTVRSGSNLDPAVDWFKKNEIPLFAICDNPDNPSGGRKIHADFFIDDRAFGCPLKDDKEGGLCVDWEKVRFILVVNGLLKLMLQSRMGLR